MADLQMMDSAEHGRPLPPNTEPSLLPPGPTNTTAETNDETTTVEPGPAKRPRPANVAPGLLRVRVARPSILLGAMPLIARWYRRQQAGLSDEPCAALGVSPATSIRRIAQTEEGTRFIGTSIAQLENTALRTSDADEAAHALGTAAALAWTIGELKRAHNHALGALAACRQAGDSDSGCEVESLLIRLKRQMRTRDIGPARSLSLGVTQVERVDGEALSLREFVDRYATPRRPVIIAGLAAEVVRDAGGPPEWSLARWRQMLAPDDPSPTAARLRAAAARHVPLKRRVALSSEWAGLEDAPRPAQGAATLGEVIERCGGDAEYVREYLFDWSLPINAPGLLEGIRIPKFFANDFLQSCASSGALYRESWPSLFVGAEGTSCGLHVDTFGSHFWCAMLDGRKRWVFFDEAQLGQLGVDYSLSADGSFCPEADAFVDALHAAPLASCDRACWTDWARTRPLSPAVCELGPGDVLFVPSGMPHAVTNVGDCLSLSANYIDSTNLPRACAEIELAALTDERALELLVQLRSRGCSASSTPPMFDIGEHVPFAHFKEGDHSAAGRWPALGALTPVQPPAALADIPHATLVGDRQPLDLD